MPSAKITINKSGLRVLTVVTVAILYGLGWTIYSLIGFDEQFLPHPENILTLLVCLVLTFNIENKYTRNVLIFWSLWFIIGSISLFSMNQLTWGLNYDVDSREANRYYLACVIAAAIGALVYQVLRKIPQRSVNLSTRGRNVAVYLLLMAFPFIYAASVVLAAGMIPIFSGQDVSASMYELDYGPVHGFGIFVAVATVVLWLELDRDIGLARGRVSRIAALALLALFLIFGSIDGRRAFTLIALMGIVLVYLEKSLDAKRLGGAIALSIGALGLYVVAAALRAGSAGSQRFGTVYTSLAAIGVEYRDYVWGYVNLSPEYVRSAGYDWLESSVASATPGFLMTLLDIDKNYWVVRDSARTLMQMWNVKLGIRVGLPGELWFEMQWFGLVIFFAFGILIQVLSFKLNRTTHHVYKAILLVGLAVCAFSIMGQSTVAFGLILPLLYLVLITYIAQLVFNKSFSSKRRAFRSTGLRRHGLNAYP